MTETSTVADGRFVRMCPAPEKGELTSCEAEVAGSKTIEQFISVWGQPKFRGTDAGQEYLVYNRGVKWRGLLGFLIIPIPLLLPVGHNETKLYFVRDRLIETIRQGWKSNIAVCGVWGEGPNEFGCRTGW
jgi:hypothetical protein